MARTDKKEQILKAAVVLFGKAHDARKVSVEEIAAEAGVSPTTIYNYFGTREALVVDSARVLMRQILKMSADVMRSDLSFGQKLQAIVAGKVDLATKYSREVLGKLMGSDKSSAVFGQRLYDEEIQPLWREFIASGKKEGYIDPAIDDEALLAYMDVLRAGIAAKPELTADYQQKMPMLMEMSKIMFHGFLKKGVELFPKEGL